MGQPNPWTTLSYLTTGKLAFTGLGRSFRLVCIYACDAVFFDATVFSANKDFIYLRHGGKIIIRDVVASFTLFPVLKTAENR